MPKPQPVGTLSGVEYFDWDSYYEARLSVAKPPVILIAKNETFGYYGVTLKTGTSEIINIGNLVAIANNIGAARAIGDTIK